MRWIASTLTVTAVLAVSSKTYADTFCDALSAIAAKSGNGFQTLKGGHEAQGRTGPFDFYKAKIVLPGATACRVVVPPPGPHFGPPSFDCDVAGANPPNPRMTRLILHIARCVGAQVANPPPYETDAEGPSFDFTAGKLNYAVSAAKDQAGVWDIDLSIAPPSP
jgi:hypothetical protein